MRLNKVSNEHKAQFSILSSLIGFIIAVGLVVKLIMFLLAIIPTTFFLLKLLLVGSVFYFISPLLIQFVIIVPIFFCMATLALLKFFDRFEKEIK